MGYNSMDSAPLPQPQTDNLPPQRNTKADNALRVGLFFNLYITGSLALFVLFIPILFNDNGSPQFPYLLEALAILLAVIVLAPSILLLREVGHRVDHYKQRIIAVWMMAASIPSGTVLSLLWSVPFVFLELPYQLASVPAYLVGAVYLVGLIWAWILYLRRDKVMLNTPPATSGPATSDQATPPLPPPQA